MSSERAGDGSSRASVASDAELQIHVWEIDDAQRRLIKFFFDLIPLLLRRRASSAAGVAEAGLAAACHVRSSRELVWREAACRTTI